MPRQPISIVDLYSPELPFATEFRRLLHKVQNTNAKTELKTIMFTSAMLAEGKSTVCSFLALTAAQLKGMKTLVLDADLRRPAIHKFFALPREPGFSDILVEGFSPKETVKKTGSGNLDIIAAGREVSRPSAVFDAEAIGQLLDDMKYYYDLILIDSAPLLPVSDPMLLASKIDCIILVVKAGATQSEIVRRAVEVLGPQRSKIIGVVLNNMDNTLPYYYDYSHYGYTYGEQPQKPGKGSARKNKEHPPAGAAPPTKKDSTDDRLVRPS